jgi:hypothetical protein
MLSDPSRPLGESREFSKGGEGLANPGNFQREGRGSTITFGFSKEGFHYYLRFSKGGYTLKMLYLTLFCQTLLMKRVWVGNHPPYGSAIDVHSVSLTVSGILFYNNER